MFPAIPILYRCKVSAKCEILQGILFVHLYQSGKGLSDWFVLIIKEPLVSQLSQIKCLTFFAIFIFTVGSTEPLVVKFADGGPKKRQQTQQNHGNVQFIGLI